MMRRLLTVTLPVVLLIVSGPAALAAWTSTGGSDGSVTATSVNQAAQPTANGGEGFVTLSWARSTLASGDPVGHYSVRRDGSEVCTSADTGSATASCIDPSPVGQTVTYTVVAVMGAWTGPASAGTSFTYDNTAPGAPSAPDLIAADDTGSSNTDNITNKSNVTVTGTAEAGSTVRIYRGAELVGSGTATGGSYSIGILLVEGENTVHATATDAAGNVSASSTTTLILSDTASPGAPTAPDLIAADDTGPSDSDNVTSKSNVTVQGSAEAGSTVKIYRGTTLLGTGVATGGSYSIGGIALVEGQNDLHATATDEAGNVSSSSVTTIILSDSAAPAAPSAPDLIAADDTGSSSTDNVTNLATVTVTGSGENGSTVRILRGTTQLGQGTVSGGSYSIAINLVEGVNDVFAKASDAAGNTSPDSATTTITLDTAAPAPPSTPDLIPADDTGSSDTDNLTNKTSVTVTGAADSGTTVRIYRGTTQLGEATASPSGYSVAISPLVEGVNTIHSTSTDTAGNIATSGTLNITVDTAPPSPAPTTPDLAPGDDSGVSNTDNITNKTTVSVTGTAPAGSTVTIYRGTTVMGSGTATGGTYNISITPLAENDNVIHASVSDAAGNTATSGTLTIVRDTTAPTVTGVVLRNGGTANRADGGDTVEIQFSEQLDAAKVCPAWTNGADQTLAGQQGNNSWVTVTITNGAGAAPTNDTLTASASSFSGCQSLSVGSVALNRNYVGTNTTFTGTGSNVSSVSLTTTGLFTVRLGTGQGSQTSVTAGAPTYTPPSGLTDLAGNALVPTAFTGSSSNF